MNQNEKPPIPKNPMPLKPAAIGFGAIIALAALTRLFALDADPPDWDDGAFITDVGWWADSARGKVLFDDYYADDFGTGYLMTPGWTHLLRAVYVIFGVGNVQTRLLAAVSNTLVILIVGLILWRGESRRAGLLGAGLLGLSPFFWMHARVGLIESTQCLFVVLSFAFWVARARSVILPVASGLAMAAAIAIKPNALNLGLLPVGAAALMMIVVQAIGCSGPARAKSLRSSVRDYLLVALSLVFGLGLVFWFHVLPNWEPFWEMFMQEAGAEEHSILQKLKIPGMAMLSTQADILPALWRGARRSPVLWIGCWLFGLGFAMKLRGGWREAISSMSPLEAASLGWIVAGSAAMFGSQWQIDRRFLTLYPALAMAAAIYIDRGLDAGWAPRPAPQTRPLGRLHGIVFWGVALAPLMVLIKPWATAAIMKLGANLPLGVDSGIGMESAATVFQGPWMLMIAALGFFAARRGEALAAGILRRAGVGLFALFAIVEIWDHVDYFGHLEKTLTEHQAELAKIIEEDELALGHVASTVFQPLKVRTTWRVRAIDVGPKDHDENIFERLRPRYLIEMRRRNHLVDTPIYEDLLDKGYESIYRFAVGRERGGVRRYEFEVFEAPPREPESASPSSPPG